MATPSIRLLYDHFGADYDFTAFGRSHILDLFDQSPWFQQHLTPPASQNHLCFGKLFSTARYLRQERFDIVVLLPNSFRSALLAWMSGVGKRVGYSHDFRDFMLTDRLSKPVEETPLVDYYLAVADFLLQREGLSTPKEESDPNRRRLELLTTAEEESLGDRIWEQLGLRRPEQVVLLNIGAANNIVKSWPIGHAIELCRLLVDQLDLDVLINCGPGEIETARKLVEESERPRVFSMADLPTNMHVGKICVKRSALTISTDSGPAHLAAAFGKPTILLLGPTSRTYIANPTIDRVILDAGLPCAPCHANEECPEKHHRCMSDLTPELVLENVRRILDRPAPGK